jgi:tetratricopeptide (TPR) repeat protein
MEFECELVLARACAAACEEMSFFSDAGDIVATLVRLAGDSSGRVWRLALLCCCGERARDLMSCAWLLSREPEGLAREPKGWAAACERVLSEMPPSEETARGFATLARIVPDRALAQTLYEQRCSLDAEPVTLAHYAVLLAALGDAKTALSVLDRLPERSQVFFFARGLVYEAAGNLEAALDAWESCAASAAVLAAQSAAWRKKGLVKQALQLAERAWQMRHELGEEASLRLQCPIAVMRAEVRGETREAENSLRRVICDNVRDDCAWFDLATVQCEACQWDEAEASIEQCLELRRAQTDDDDLSCAVLEALNQRALVLCGLGRRSEAEAMWQRLVRVHESRSEWQSMIAAMFNLGHLAEQGGDLEAAEVWYARCVQEEQTKLADSTTVSRIELCHRLATVEAALGKNDCAQRLHATCVEVARHLVGPEHSAVAALSALI